MTDAPAAWSTADLDRVQYAADPPADEAVARIVGPWPALGADATAEQLRGAHEPRWQRLAQATRLLDQMNGNQSLANWAPTDDQIDPEIAAAMQTYVRGNQGLPAWADAAKLERAEALFMDDGVLSCVLLFCASLPECYVLPHLSAVLHVTGQLEQRTDYRVRRTAAMVVPVMMKGGLAGDHGEGRAALLKVRLIHATIRNLILRGTPAAAVARLGASRNTEGAHAMPRLAALSGSQSPFEALFATGWDIEKNGAPCNQEEMAYTLLTFSYVFLRGMRRLGLGLPTEDEDAFLHCWNVAGSVLGLRTDLMAHSMADAQALFERIRRSAADGPVTSDPRPALGRALIADMERVIPTSLFKPFAVLMTRRLCGRTTTRLIGADERVPLISQALFGAMMMTARLVDTLVRLVWPQFSITRMIVRVLGYHLMVGLLLDQTRPLKLPEKLLNSVNSAMDGWSDDPKNPRWINALEDRFTKSGSWSTAGVSAPI